MDSQGTKCCRNIAENLNRLRRAHERYRQTDRRQTTDKRQTDGRAIVYSEREREFTFANEKKIIQFLLCFSIAQLCTTHTDIAVLSVCLSVARSYCASTT